MKKPKTLTEALSVQEHQAANSSTDLVSDINGLLDVLYTARFWKKAAIVLGIFFIMIPIFSIKW